MGVSYTIVLQQTSAIFLLISSGYGSMPFAYMPDYDRSGYAVVVETHCRILHTDEEQATYTYDSPLTHPLSIM